MNLVDQKLDSEQASWPRRQRSLFETKGDKSCARDNEPKQRAAWPEGLTVTMSISILELFPSPALVKVRGHQDYQKLSEEFLERFILAFFY